MSDKLHFSRSERGQARRMASRLLSVETLRTRSGSNPNIAYTTRVEADGKVLCDCPGWTIKKLGKPRQCKHTKELIGARATREVGEFLYIDREGTQ